MNVTVDGVAIKIAGGFTMLQLGIHTASLYYTQQLTEPIISRKCYHLTLPYDMQALHW